MPPDFQPNVPLMDRASIVTFIHVKVSLIEVATNYVEMIEVCSGQTVAAQKIGYLKTLSHPTGRHPMALVTTSGAHKQERPSRYVLLTESYRSAADTAACAQSGIDRRFRFPKPNRT